MPTKEIVTLILIGLSVALIVIGLSLVQDTMPPDRTVPITPHPTACLDYDLFKY